MIRAFDKLWAAFDELIADVSAELKGMPAGVEKVEEITTKETRDGVTIVTKVVTKTYARVTKDKDKI